MAISEQNLHVAGVQSILEKGNIAYDKLANGRSQTQILELTCEEILALIAQLEKQEKDLFAKMDGVNSIQDFINKYKQAVSELNLNQFTGLNLKNNFIKEFINAVKKIDLNIDKQMELFAQLLLDAMHDAMGDVDLHKLERWFKTVINQAGDAVLIVSDQGPAKFVQEGPFKNTIITKEEDGALKIIGDNLTDKMKDNLGVLIKNKNTLNRIPLLEKVGIDKISVSDDILTVKVYSEWYDLISFNGKALKESDILRLIKDKPKIFIPLRDKANNKIKAMILNKVGHNKYVEDALNQMLSQNENMFFVGRNEKQITGLLGEMAAYATLKKIFGGGINLKWIAQDLKNGKQLSLDLLLEDMYGIQVKNTTDDLKDFSSGLGGLHRIHFVDKSANEVIKQLTDSDALANVYETSYFNISYCINHDNRPHVIPGSSSFDKIATELVNLREQIHIFLLRFSPQLLYIANDASLKSQLATLTTELRQKVSGNILYIVGNQPVFASQMLKEIEQQIRKIIDICNENGVNNISGALNIRASSGTTIIDYLNDKAANEGMIGLDKQGFLGGKGFTTTTLTSSFGFG